MGGEWGGGGTSFTYFNPKTNLFSLSAGQTRHVLGQWILFRGYGKKIRKEVCIGFCCRLIWLQSPPLVSSCRQSICLLHRAKKDAKKKGKGLFIAVSAALK
jgi:hypothetical protein